MEHRVSVSQLEVLIGFLETHPQLAKGGVGLGGRSKETISRKWDELALSLNACGSGATKSGARWKRYWIDLKHRVKSRAAQYRQDATGTGGDPGKVEALSEIDRRILAILGEAAVFGDTEHRVPLFGTIASEPTHMIEEQPAQIMLAPQMESRMQKATPSGSGVTSPVRRPVKRRLPATPTRSKFKQRQRVGNDWVVELEERRMEAEGKLASAALGMAEASKIQSETSKIQAEASKIQAESSRTLAEAALIQVQVAKEMTSNITKLIEMLEK